MRRSRSRTSSLPARAGFSKPRVAEAGPAALEVRDAPAIGPPNAIDQFKKGNSRFTLSRPLARLGQNLPHMPFDLRMAGTSVKSGMYVLCAAPPFKINRPPYLISESAPGIVECFHDYSSDQIVPARKARCNEGGPKQKTRLDRRRRFRRYRGSAGAQASRCRNNAGRPAQSPYLSAAAVPGRHRCFGAIGNSGPDPAARGETEEPQRVAGRD